jgi:ABC-2 type transport system ATP-binding protein
VTAAAEFESVAKTYKTRIGAAGVVALRGVSLSVPSGSAFALLGPNRAGKTTLIKLLLNLAAPSSGNVQRLGQSINKRETLANVGYMHENHAFPRYLGAEEVLKFYGNLTGIPPEPLPKLVDNVLGRVGLADRSREPISRFSKGMVQRLGLAQAILNEPKLLVLDEPTEGLDLHGRQLLREVVKETVAAGRTVLMVSHTLNEVEALCDRAAVLNAGKLAWQGSIADLKQRGRGNIEAALETLYRAEGP